MTARSALIELQCVSCDKRYDPKVPTNVCTACGSMLSCFYDYEKAKETLNPGEVSGREKSLWRYSEILPVIDPSNVVSLGEGLTPIIRLSNELMLKDDGQIPTGTFKARGMAIAVSRAKELGLKKLAVPSAGNAGAALACYAARGGLSAKVFMPEETPASMVRECLAYGAEVIQVPGNISDAATKMKENMGEYFDMSTLKEPYRLEGKKTMGYEIAEQTNFHLPDVIIYPTGGGTGLLGMWKSFAEMEKLGWIGSERPKMLSVQSADCAPIVDALNSGKDVPDADYPDGKTVATGLRVPRPFAGKQILSVLRESRGGAVKIVDKEIPTAMTSLARKGIFVCPEGAATLAAYQVLINTGAVTKDEQVLLYNTGTGLKYLELFR